MYYYSKSVAWQKFDDCIYIIDNKNEQVFCLENELSKIIWENIDGKNKKDIIEFFIKKLDIKDNRLIIDIEKFINDLEKNNLVEVQ